MINSIYLYNFKCFENQNFDFSLLTLLTGLNNTGKSSVLQALLLLRQSYQQDLLQQTGLVLNSDLVCIGTARDALFEDAKEEKLGFNITASNKKTYVWRFRYNTEADVLSLDSPPVNSEVFQSSLFQDNFHYIQAERLGPKTAFEMSDFGVRQHRQLGIKGAYAAHFLLTFERDEIPNKKLGHPKAESFSLRDQVEAWMGEISPGTRIHLTSHSGMDLVNLEYSFETGNHISNNYRTTNAGFGITYILPILISILSSSPEALILIENPEAHLHPKGQSMMGHLLALAASCGVQVVVETHSDHVLNGIRLAVHGGKIKPEDICLHFFQRIEENGQALTQVVTPQIDRNGRINQWPDGFFDEWDKSLDALLEPAQE